MTLREAAERTGRSITTLRRYIRSGRLHAEKRYGRFGPEYFVSAEDLTDAGLEAEPRPKDDALAPSGPATPSTAPPPANALTSTAWIREIVPLGLYQELQMKHEQLLVQYGMVRASGMRAGDARSALERAKRAIEETKRAGERERERLTKENRRLREELRSAHVELEGKQLEVSALEEKARALEMMTRNSVTNETLSGQLDELRKQHERVRGMKSRIRGEDGGGDPPAKVRENAEPDH